MVFAGMHFLNGRIFKVSAKTMGGTVCPTKHIAEKCQNKGDNSFYDSEGRRKSMSCIKA